MKTILAKPILSIGLILLMLGMLRAGFWQLERADEKQIILDAQQSLSKQKPELLRPENELQRFKPIEVIGEYVAQASLFLDNQVVDSKVGYRVFTPLQLVDSNTSVLVDRGWISVGESRATLPQIDTPSGVQRLIGRLNNPAPPPPLWDSDFPAANGRVWQYLPIEEIAQELELELISMVVELRPSHESESNSGLIRRWLEIDDKWVARHNAYAFQWFAMATALLIACLILIFLSFKRRSN